jgi:hypothetical protein
MAKVYDKNGGEFEVTHPIDVNGWIEAGYLKEKPKKAQTRKRVPKKEKDN